MYEQDLGRERRSLEATSDKTYAIGQVMNKIFQLDIALLYLAVEPELSVKTQLRSATCLPFSKGLFLNSDPALLQQSHCVEGQACAGEA